MMPRLTAGVRTVGALVVLVIALMSASQFFLPAIIEHRIETVIHQSFDDVKFARVEVDAFPAVRMLGGQLSSITVDARRVDLGHLTLDAILLDGRELRLDMRRLLGGEGVVIRSADALRATLVITEDDLNRYFWESFNQSQFFKVTLKRGEATLAGRLRVLGRDVEVEVSGHFRVDGGTSVVFIPQDVTVANARLPQGLFDAATQEWHIPLHWNQEAMPLVITDLLVEDGKLLVYGTYPR